MEQRPLLAITMGDPAGIGPEIIAKTVKSGALPGLCRPVVIGDAAVMKKLVDELGFSLDVRSISEPEQADPAADIINVVDLNHVSMDSHQWGKPDVTSGSAVVAFIKKAVDLAMNNRVDAVVTAPINKAIINAAGYRYAGHTELLAYLTGASEYGMMFVGGGLRVILATIHLALKDVPAHITAAGILRTLRLAHKAMRSFGVRQPRIGVAALNPHAGEGRLFGDEERENILPAVVEAREEGIDASDPVPADTLFYKALHNHYDIVVAMYHDQGLAPLKMLAFGNAVNVTVGLPIIRTSVDHGTAYDIAGRGRADPASLLEAIRTAAALAAFRESQSKEGA